MCYFPLPHRIAANIEKQIKAPFCQQKQPKIKNKFVHHHMLISTVTILQKAKGTKQPL